MAICLLIIFYMLIKLSIAYEYKLKAEAQADRAIANNAEYISVYIKHKYKGVK